MNEIIKYKCISAASVTHAQKAVDILRRNGIDAYMTRQSLKNVFGCARCVKVREKDLAKAVELLKKGGVKTSGDVYDM